MTTAVLLRSGMMGNYHVPFCRAVGGATFSPTLIVCTIIAKDNPDLRGLGGCWGIVTELREFSCLVRAWNGAYAVREENLKDLGYSPAQKEEAKQISDSLSKLYSPELEETAKAILASLGKIDRPFLTAFEEKLLQFLEGESVD